MKLFPILLSLLLCLTVFSTLILPVQADTSSVMVQIKPSSQEVSTGEEFTLTIYADPYSEGVSGGEINLEFNSAIMKIVSVEAGDLLGSDPLVGVEQIDNEVGTLKYALARSSVTTAPTQSGNFVTLIFSVLETAESGTYSIRLTKVGLADENFIDILGITLSQGSITIIEISPPSPASESPPPEEAPVEEALPALQISVLRVKDPVKVGKMQKIKILVLDENGNRIRYAQIEGIITDSLGDTHTFNGLTKKGGFFGGKGIFVYKWQIDATAEEGKFTVEINASLEAYNDAIKTLTFTVIHKK